MPLPPRYDENDLPPAPLDMERLLEDSVAFIVKHQNYDEFSQWLLTNLSRYTTPGALLLRANPSGIEQLGRSMLKPIWNACPLPGNKYRPSPLPKPKRNEPCCCGSGKKYKKCCAEYDDAPEMPPDVLWPLAIKSFNDKEVIEAIRNKWISLQAVGMIAEHFLEEGKPKKASLFIEPIFIPEVLYTDEKAGYLLDIICDCYSDLEYGKKKLALLQHISSSIPKSSLRSDAWQRLATVTMDSGDSEASWNYFRKAMQDNPDSPYLSVLEVQLLMAEGNHSKATERAKFWAAKLNKRGHEDYQRIIEFLEEVIDNPGAAMAVTGMSSVDGPEFLPTLIHRMSTRPIPEYTIQPITLIDIDEDPDGFRELMASRLRDMGVPDNQVDAALDDLMEQAHNLKNADGGTHRDDKEDFELLPPADIREVEALWADVFPLDKPFGVHEYPVDEHGVWEPDTSHEWAGFLQEHPEAFDSIDILDDLVTALYLHPYAGPEWLGEALLLPLLQRAGHIVGSNLSNQSIKLTWSITEHRPFLRPFARLAYYYLDNGSEKAYEFMKEYMALNPTDNHGFRCELMNYYLKNAMDEEAFALGSMYPEDMHAETVYGTALALFRLGKKKAAREALQTAINNLPKVADYIKKPKIKKPKLQKEGIRIGGNDQAWLYREAMRDEWLKTPEALEALSVM